MTDVTIGDKLREMAEHRGLKLVRSRRRKPGTGDYGKFGLTDAAGKPLLGIGDAGLTASPEDVEQYLRAGATSTWKASAKATPARPASARKAARTEPAGEKAEPERADRRPQRASEAPEPVRRAEPEPAAAPRLAIRPARPADAAALVPLLRQLASVDIDELGIARNLAAVRKAGGGMLVAELGEPVGCCGWAVLPTVQHGPVGRLTLLLVDQAYRRRGIATALLDAATEALREAGCSRIEAMSDIAIRNAHNFFRTLRFEQTSYRFARPIDGT